jgi:Putative peptidoglycan binding domain
MKTNGLIFVSCLAAGALIASPAIGKPAKKSVSKSKRVAAQTTQVTRHNQNIGSRTGSTRYYGNRSYAGRQYNGTRYAYRGTRSYANYYGGGRNYYGGNYPYYSSNWSYGIGGGYYPYSYYGGYPYSGYNNYYSYYGGYPYNGYNTYSYYTPTYRYNGSTVAAVQQRLGRLGYYHGVVDGIMGPQTRNAIAAFESRNGLGVDGTISGPLLDSLGLG